MRTRHADWTGAEPGTPMALRTVGELVAERPGRSRIFHTYGIDFCCQGGRTLEEACGKKGLPLTDILQSLEQESEEPAQAPNPAELPPTALIDHIERVHHGFLREELPRLHSMARRVAQVHGGHTPSLRQVCEVFEGLFSELDSHMAKEEQILFPAIRALEANESAPVLPLDGPIACMIHEHEDAGAALSELRGLTENYQPPADACNTYRALFAGLKDLETDLHRHIHLENQVLFPAAERLMRAAS